MIKEIDDLRKMVRALNPGGRLRVTRSVLRDLGPLNIWLGTIPAAQDRVLSGITGAGYEYGWENAGTHGQDIEFYRLEHPLGYDDVRRTYVDPDRRHLYRLAGGLYHPRGSIPA